MVSYTDVVTILLILFVAAAAKGTRQAKPPERKTVPAPVARPFPSGLVRTERMLEAEGVKPRLEARGLVIDLPQKVLFPSGEDRIDAGALATIDVIARVLRSIPNKVMLVGHADAVPIHNSRFHDNWELSAARSLELLDLLSGRYGIPESRLAVASYGSWNPRRPNDTEDGRAENRRVEIVILDEAAAASFTDARSPSESDANASAPLPGLVAASSATR
jgi:chemotaxis protein MotB